LRDDRRHAHHSAWLTSDHPFGIVKHVVTHDVYFINSPARAPRIEMDYSLSRARKQKRTIHGLALAQRSFSRHDVGKSGHLTVLGLADVIHSIQYPDTLSVRVGIIRISFLELPFVLVGGGKLRVRSELCARPPVIQVIEPSSGANQ